MPFSSFTFEKTVVAGHQGALGYGNFTKIVWRSLDNGASRRDYSTLSKLRTTYSGKNITNNKC